MIIINYDYVMNDPEQKLLWVETTSLFLVEFLWSGNTENFPGQEL